MQFLTFVAICGVTGTRWDSNLPGHSITWPNAICGSGSGLPTEPGISMNRLSALASEQFSHIQPKAKPKSPLLPNPAKSGSLPDSRAEPLLLRLSPALPRGSVPYLFRHMNLGVSRVPHVRIFGPGRLRTSTRRSVSGHDFDLFRSPSFPAAETLQKITLK